jgi:uncharacterized phage-associated protein
MKGFQYKKSVQSLNFFAIKSGGNLNKMKALKLIWLADRYHLRHFGRTITGDVYFAMPYGPVASTTRDILEKNTGLSDSELNYGNEFLETSDKYHYNSSKDFDKKPFSSTDIEVLEKIFNQYSKYSEFELSKKSHSFPEWKKWESALEKEVGSRFEISLEDFFINYNDGENLFNDDEDYLQLSKTAFSD